MNDPLRIEIARRADAPAIARMSRDLIEHGLPWSWRAGRVLRRVCSTDSTVITARRHGRLAGFAVMRFGTEEARLDLLAVHGCFQRHGLGTTMVRWLERSARVAGIPVIYLEVRETNHGARAFYHRLGYRRVGRVPGYYFDREAALRLARDLWEGHATGTGPVAPASPWEALIATCGFPHH